MRKMTSKILNLSLCCIPLMLHASPAIADRQNTLSGSINLSQAYDSNIDRTDTGEIEEWTTSVIPSITFTSKSSKDSINLNYSPNFTYNYRTDVSTFKYSSLSLAADRQLSERTKITLHDSYEKSDDSTRGRDETQDTTNRVNLSENRPRNEYWANYFNVASNWQYRENSDLSLGFNYSVLNNSGPTEDFQKYAPRVSINHEINHQWSVRGGYVFTKGDFESSPDTREHNINGVLSYHLTPHKTIFGVGDYLTTDNDGNKTDYHTTGGQLGYSQQLDEKTALSCAAGYSVTEIDNGQDSDGMNYTLSLRRMLEKGAFSLTGAGGYENQQFNGENLGLSQFWSFKSTIAYQLAERLSSAAYALYSNNKYIQDIPERKDNSYEVGGSLSWSFYRWYAAGVRYVFHKLDSNQAGNDYEDHRVFMTLSASKDLWIW